MIPKRIFTGLCILLILCMGGCGTFDEELDFNGSVNVSSCFTIADYTICNFKNSENGAVLELIDINEKNSFVTDQTLPSPYYASGNFLLGKMDQDFVVFDLDDFKLHKIFKTDKLVSQTAGFVPYGKVLYYIGIDSETQQGELYAYHLITKKCTHITTPSEFSKIWIYQGCLYAAANLSGEDTGTALYALNIPSEIQNGTAEDEYSPNWGDALYTSSKNNFSLFQSDSDILIYEQGSYEDSRAVWLNQSITIDGIDILAVASDGTIYYSKPEPSEDRKQIYRMNSDGSAEALAFTLESSAECAVAINDNTLIISTDTGFYQADCITKTVSKIVS